MQLHRGAQLLWPRRHSGTQVEEKGQVPSCKDSREWPPRAYMLIAPPLLRVELASQGQNHLRAQGNSPS